MNYTIRRKDREETREAALAIIDRAPFGVLATVDPDGQPYCIPLSIARSGDLLYFHCALPGHKIDNLRRDPRVCVSFTGDLNFPEDHFTVMYESAVVKGRAEELTSGEDKIFGLKRICERFTPANMKAFESAVEKMLSVTGVWKIYMDELAGKRRK